MTPGQMQADLELAWAWYKNNGCDDIAILTTPRGNFSEKMYYDAVSADLYERWKARCKAAARMVFKFDTIEIAHDSTATHLFRVYALQMYPISEHKSSEGSGPTLIQAILNSGVMKGGGK